MPALWHRWSSSSSPPRRAQLIERQTQARHAAVRRVLLEEAVERERVLHLGRGQFQQLGNFDDRLQAARTAAAR